MSALYDQIAALDKGIADRWKSRSNDNPDYELTDRDVDAIVHPLLNTTNPALGRKGISEKQAQAIVKMLHEAKISQGGMDRMRFLIGAAQDASALDMTQVTTDEDLSRIIKALSLGATFSFTSPGTNIAYAPHHYWGIAKLISQHKITVFQAHISDLWKLTKEESDYRSDHNYLLLYLLPGDSIWTSIIIHEATHAIQDWLDATRQRRHIEADAYIAEAATMRESLIGGSLREAAFRASRFVVDGKAMPRNKDWQKAYDKVVAAYEDSLGSSRDLITENEVGGTESSEYQKILDAIDWERAEAVANEIGVLP